MTHEPCVLVIDDDTNLRNTVALILEHTGCAVTTAANAQAGLRALEQLDYDLVFLDLLMPEMDGRTLLPIIRQRYPCLPVLILTAQSSAEVASELRQKGASGLLNKPIDPQRIVAVAHALIAGKGISGPEAGLSTFSLPPDKPPDDRSSP